VHARVEQLWRGSRAGRALTTEEIAALRTIFGAKALKKAGLTVKRASQKDALEYLLEREPRLLAKKTRRVRVLVERARAGYVLGDDEKEEIVEMFGERLAARAGIGSNVTLGPASLALAQSPREAVPAVWVNETPGGAQWLSRPDLLDSGGEERHFVVEVDGDGRAHLRFGDGDRGRAPLPGTRLTPTYRVGNGARGNVGAEAISRIVFWHGLESGGNRRVRNPLPAQGGTAPEPLSEVKLYAPGAFRRELERAVVSDDYARLAERSDPAAIQRAAAPPLRWTGSWYEAQVAIDPRGSEQLEDALREEADAYLQRYRRIGHDLRVMPARYAALNIELSICVLPHYLRAHIEAELLDLFSNRDLGDGRRGFFHPDNLTFGGGIQLSRLVAAAQAVAGVESVVVTRLQRLHEKPHGEIEDGILPVRSLEVARLDNDKGAPDHGVLKLILGGGR
jgi:predicted phage baseplate assembly protein